MQAALPLPGLFLLCTQTGEHRQSGDDATHGCAYIRRTNRWRADHAIHAGRKGLQNRLRTGKKIDAPGQYTCLPQKAFDPAGDKQYIYAYLFRNLQVQRVNQVWAIDITYVPMQKGFMYLTAVIDVYSRYIVGWGLSNTLDAEASLQVLRQAVAEHGEPEIINSDQGSQFTCKEYVDFLKEEQIRISMDGKGRALDNIFIERFWRTIKYQHIYLNPAQDGITLYQGISCWIDKYNHKPHQGINRNKPANLYQMAA